ncbi:MAG: TlpA family protein disulfide reductase [Bacteroidia bacterium]|nr:TlpA family protein disulfide reductase [Bacteroidia bacterium]
MTTVKFLSAGALVLSIVGYTMYNNSAKPSHNQKAETAIAKTAALPDFVLKNEKGVALNLNSFKGKKVFVNLWATWCGPCRREMPSIEALYNKTKGKKVEFVMLSLDDDFNKAINYKASTKLTMPMYYPGANLPALFNVDGIPATFVFNEKGELIKTIQGSTNYDTQEFVDLLTK